MAETALVESKVTDAIALLGALDKSGNGPTVAVWYYYDDANQWRLIIAGPTYDQLKEPFAYKGLAETIADSNLQSLSVSDLKLLPTTAPLIAAFRLLVRTPPKGIMRARFANNTLNGIFLRDMLVLRCA